MPLKMDRRSINLNELAWGLPLIYIVLSRGGCLEKGLIAFLLGIPPSTVRRMVWGLRKRRLVETEASRVCVTSGAKKFLRHLIFVARKRNHYVLVFRGLLVMVSHRSNSASARLIPMDLACIVHDQLKRGLSDYREVARTTGLPPKTVSYTLKALGILGCRGASECVLERLCRAQ